MSIWLSLFSEIAFEKDGTPRPIHILRTGTFTANSGQPFTFETRHLAAIVNNFKAGKRRNPPITERHDFGRALGRIVNVWLDTTQTQLYAQPKWTTEGRKLLADEVYDGFSAELEHPDGDAVLIGGTLTNYPAVTGLSPVTLVVPPPVQAVASNTPLPPPSFSAPLSPAYQREMLTELYRYLFQLEWIREQPAIERDREVLKYRAMAGYLSDRQEQTAPEGALSYDAARRRWAQLVDAKVAQGLSQFDAMVAVMREHRDVYEAQSYTKETR